VLAGHGGPFVGPKEAQAAFSSMRRAGS
jgi:hypothetical protein